MFRVLLGCGLAALVAACSSPVAQRAIERLSGPVPGEGAGEMSRLETAQAPRMAVWMLDSGLASTLRLAAERDGVRQWRASDNVGIFTRDGIIIGTRGMSFDLMTADPGAAAALIRAGRGGQITRVHRELDGQDRLEIRSYVCDIVPAEHERIRTGEDSHATTLRIDEICHSPGGGLTNRYWVLNGSILQSEQIFNHHIGRIRILFLP